MKHTAVLVISKMFICLVLAFTVSGCAKSTPQQTTNKEDVVLQTNKIPPSLEKQLESPPEGFKWQIFKDAIFLIPNAWFEHITTSDELGFPVHTYGASPTDFSKKKMFEMGFSAQIYNQPKKHANITAKEIAYTHIAWIVKEHKKEDFIILDKENDTVRDIYYVRYKDAPSGLKPIIIHKFIIANNETDSVHMFIFESPVETWDADWKKYGTPILEKIKVIMVADKQ